MKFKFELTEFSMKFQNVELKLWSQPFNQFDVTIITVQMNK